MGEAKTIHEVTNWFLKETAAESTEAYFRHYVSPDANSPFVLNAAQFGHKTIDELTTEEIREVLSDPGTTNPMARFRALDLVIVYGIMKEQGTNNPCDPLRTELASRNDQPSASHKAVKVSPELEQRLTEDFRAQVASIARQANDSKRQRRWAVTTSYTDPATGVRRMRKRFITGSYADARKAASETEG